MRTNFIPFAFRSFLGGGGPARFRDVIENAAVVGRISELEMDGRGRHFQQFRLEDAIANCRLLPSQWFGREGWFDEVEIARELWLIALNCGRILKQLSKKFRCNQIFNFSPQHTHSRQHHNGLFNGSQLRRPLEVTSRSNKTDTLHIRPRPPSRLRPKPPLAHRLFESRTRSSSHSTRWRSSSVESVIEYLSYSKYTEWGFVVFT